MSAIEDLCTKLNETVQQGNFEAVFDLVRKERDVLGKALQRQAIHEALKKSTQDRRIIACVDGVGFEDTSLTLNQVLTALEKLLVFTEGPYVLDSVWGLGKIKRVDTFMRRITVDFNRKMGHQFTFAAAADKLTVAPDNHILLLRANDEAAFNDMRENRKADFVKAILASYGELTVARLEDICIQNDLVKRTEWKKFWSDTREAVRSDKTIKLPVRRTDPIVVNVESDGFNSAWLAHFAGENDPKRILKQVRELFANSQKWAALTDQEKEVVANRTRFALTAARNVDFALFAQLIECGKKLGFPQAEIEGLCQYLWERKRYIRAAAELPARDIAAFLRTMGATNEGLEKLAKAIPDFCKAAVDELITNFQESPIVRNKVIELLKQPVAPATLVAFVVGKYIGSNIDFTKWEKFPPFVSVLQQAITLGEGRQSGETLKMQNIVRRLFGTEKWMADVFKALNEADLVLFFERFQASIAWDPSSHHKLVMRMMNLCPELLESHLVKLEKKREYARITSKRSYAYYKADYLKLINETMPANVKRIEEAKGYGDLSENAEYQYAKDEQRALMKRQQEMQDMLAAVKPGDFADAKTDEVMPGVGVVVDTPEGEKTYYILGEWDNDIDLHILSSRTQLAKNLLGKKVGDRFNIPNAEELTVLGHVKEILPLPETIREWMALPAGMQI